jgi:hypothetical protein
LTELDVGHNVRSIDRMNTQVMHHIWGVIKADDIGYTSKRFLDVAGVAGGQVIHQPHPLAAQAGGVVPEMTHVAL